MRKKVTKKRRKDLYPTIDVTENYGSVTVKWRGGTVMLIQGRSRIQMGEKTSLKLMHFIARHLHKDQESGFDHQNDQDMCGTPGGSCGICGE